MIRARCLAARLTLFAAFAAFSTMAGIANAADRVIFVTDYGLYGRHAYYFLAMEKGYYARENLEIEIVRSQGSANTIKQVANGTAQIGFADAFAVVLGRANDDIPVKLVAIVLIVAGALGLLVGGFSYTKETHDVKIGPVELSVKEKQDVNIPVWAGIAAIVVGGALLLFGNKKS